MRAPVLLLALFLSLVSCRTVPNESPPPIPVPSGLSENDVQLALVLSVAGGGPIPGDLTPGEQIADEALGAILRDYEGVRSSWFFEGREPGVVFLGFQQRGFYMRVAARYTRSAVTLSILDSRNLSQSSRRIHRRAFEWLQRLEGRIRQALGAVAARNLYNATDTTDPAETP